MRPAWETMFRRTSLNSSFMRSEMRFKSCRCVTSLPNAFAIGPSSCARAARTGCAGSIAKDGNCGRMCVVNCAGVKGVLICRHASMTRTASLRTSCSLSFRSWMKGAIKWPSVISGPKAAQNRSKCFAKVKRTRHERSSAASFMTETVYCLFSSSLNVCARTNVVWTQATRMVSCVSSWESCL